MAKGLLLKEQGPGKAEDGADERWGAPGIDVGQFMVPHNLAIDEAVRIYVADRESHRVQVFDREEGEEAGRFIAPHGIAVDSRGDIYVAEAAYTTRGRHLDPPRELRSIKKLRRLG